MTVGRFFRSTAWAVFILALCGIPGEHIPEPDFWKWLKWDKLAHILLFGVQAYLLMRDSTPFYGNKLTFWLMLSAVAYGVVIEWLQATVFTGRSGDLRDAAANALGVFAGWLLFRRLRARA